MGKFNIATTTDTLNRFLSVREANTDFASYGTVIDFKNAVGCFGWRLLTSWTGFGFVFPEVVTNGEIEIEFSPLSNIYFMNCHARVDRLDFFNTYACNILGAYFDAVKKFATRHEISKRVNGILTNIGRVDKTNVFLQPGTFHKLKFTTSNSTLTAFLDKSQVLQVTDTSLTSGRFGFQCRGVKLKSIELFYEGATQLNYTFTTEPNDALLVCSTNVASPPTITKDITNDGIKIVGDNMSRVVDNVMYNDCYSEVTGYLPTGGIEILGALVRTATFHDGYLGYYYNGSVYIGHYSAGIWTVLASQSVGIYTGQHKVKTTVVGTTIKMYFDGVERLSVVDSTHKFGFIGFQLANNVTIQNIEGGYIDTTAPGVPTNFNIDGFQSDNVVLSWTNPTDTDLERVIVERSTNGTNFSVIKELWEKEERYVDKDLTDGIYYYRIKASDTNRNDSSYTEILQISIPYTPDTEGVIGGILTTKSVLKDITINGTSTVYSFPIDLRYMGSGGKLAIYYKAVSSAGTPDLTIYIEESYKSDGDFVIPEGLASFTVTDENNHLLEKTVPIAKYLRFKVAGGSSNPSDTVLNLRVSYLEAFADKRRR